MNILSVENISKSLGLRRLFEGLTFGISRGEKVALVARNGMGKTTLLNILSGKDNSDSGSVVFQKDTRMAFLEQEPYIPENISIFDALYSAENPLLKVILEYEDALQHQEQPKRLELAMDAMETHAAWDYEQRIIQILSELKMHDLQQNTSSLSGGQRKRLALALALIQEPDFLILDEPTNHLDLHMIEWLEEYLSTRDLTLFMVTHDRYFLDRVCDVIVEIDGGSLFRYQGNFSYFMEKKAERLSALDAGTEKAKNLYRKELDWMRRQPQARTTKSKSRIDAFYQVEERAKQRQQEKQVKLEVMMSRLGRKILEIDKLSKSFPDKVIVNDFSFVFKQRDRIGIIGENGTGKSTFLKMITGNMQADSGSIDVGETIVFGYYTQDGLPQADDKRVIEVVKDIAEFLPIGKNKVLSASQLLERFLFSGDQQYTLVSKLSGGERRRLFLCTILIKNPNFLILDEPTNDLDIQTLTVLEDFLEEFGGCILIVSHDRYFMDKLVDHLFIFEGKGIIRDYNGNYSDYREEAAELELRENREKRNLQLQEKKSGNVELKKPSGIQASKKDKLSEPSFKEQREFDTLAKDIADLERRKQELHVLFANPAMDAEELKLHSEELEQLMQMLEKKERTWLELCERVPGLLKS